MALTLGIQTCQILTNNDEVYSPSLSSILLAVLGPAQSCNLTILNVYETKLGPI